MRLINNFVGVKPIEVTAMRNPQCGALVSIRQDGGAMSFLHSMKPDQALAMANALIEAAHQLLGYATNRTALEKALKHQQALDAKVIKDLTPDAYRYRYLRDTGDLCAELSGLTGADFDDAVDAVRLIGVAA